MILPVQFIHHLHMLVDIMQDAQHLRILSAPRLIVLILHPLLLPHHIYLQLIIIPLI